VIWLWAVLGMHGHGSFGVDLVSFSVLGCRVSGVRVGHGRADAKAGLDRGRLSWGVGSRMWLHISCQGSHYVGEGGTRQASRGGCAGVARYCAVSWSSGELRGRGVWKVARCSPMAPGVSSSCARRAGGGGKWWALACRWRLGGGGDRGVG